MEGAIESGARVIQAKLYLDPGKYLRNLASRRGPAGAQELKVIVLIEGQLRMGSTWLLGCPLMSQVESVVKSPVVLPCPTEISLSLVVMAMGRSSLFLTKGLLNVMGFYDICERANGSELTMSLQTSFGQDGKSGGSRIDDP